MQVGFNDNLEFLLIRTLRWTVTSSQPSLADARILIAAGMGICVVPYIIAKISLN